MWFYVIYSCLDSALAVVAVVIGPSNYKDFIPQLTDNGYGVILPELLGYGETDKPTEVEAYAFNPMCKQLAGILDAEGVDKVIGLGHDFGEALDINESLCIHRKLIIYFTIWFGMIGAPLIARFSQFYPDRVTGIILCVNFPCSIYVETFAPYF